MHVKALLNPGRRADRLRKEGLVMGKEGPRKAGWVPVLMHSLFSLPRPWYAGPASAADR